MISEDTYCYNCGEEDLGQYTYTGNFAGTLHFTCKSCGCDFTGSEEE